MKTEALKQALDLHGFDVIFGGARRDEEKSRAKERVFSFRSPGHRWDPKKQRPELWNLYNTRIQKGESLRVFPLSNWTEAESGSTSGRAHPHRPALFREGAACGDTGAAWIMVDDGRLPLEPGEKPEMRMVRFRTLGCYPLTGPRKLGHDAGRDHRGDLQRPRLRTAGAADRFGPAGLHGEEEAGRVLLMEGTVLRFITCGSVDDGKSTLIGRLLHESRASSRTSSRPGARFPPVRDPGRRRWTSPCWWTASRRNGSRASPSMWPTGFSPRRTAATSSRTRPGMSSTPATWRRAPPRRIWPSSWWTPAKAC